ncbi:hypothetical protein C2845_PM01G06040 [Panicum miliaceum]|uniref:Uncharacterized protein n=1 Tax=Panicum miliaceum TaxID=4540 RepID=A0A3L6TK27_PANMI|nr:hypothetical protein C2845_PM01G06040 [Panicum miliaceum]
MPAPPRASSRLSAFRPWAAREARSAAQASRRSCSTECRRGPWCCGTWRSLSRDGREDGAKRYEWRKTPDDGGMSLLSVTVCTEVCLQL